MARKGTAVAAPAEDEGGLRSRMHLHDALVAYIEETYSVDMNKLPANEVVAWAFAKRNEWRATDGYRELLEEHRAEAEATKAEKAAARAAKPKAEKATKAKKATKKVAAPRKAAPAKKVAGKKAAPRKATKGATEDPFA